MTRLADPQRCPSCRAELLPAQNLVCSGCGLDLRGDLGVRLFGLLTEADSVIAAMRARTAAAPSGAPAHLGAAAPGVGPTVTPRGTPSPSVPPTPGPVPGPVQPLHPGQPVRPAPGVRASAVPKVLLGLGALCVLVAASLFLPFAWELLGVVGRTIVLIALTVAAGAASLAAGRRSLRATAEALGVVMLGLLAFDLLGARTSGWFGDISDAGLSVLLGVVLLAAATGSVLVLRRTPVGAFVGGEAAAVLGSILLAAGAAGLDVGSTSHRLAVLVPVLAGVVVVSAVLRRPRPGLDTMALATAGHAAVGALAWVALVLSAVDQLEGDGLSFAAMWPGGAGLTLLLAGAYAVAPAMAPQLAAGVRATGLAVALLPWALAVSAPAYDEGGTGRLLAMLALILVGLALVQALPRGWSLAGAPLTGVAALVVTALVAPLVVTAVHTLAATVVPAWEGTTGGRAQPMWAGSDPGELGSPWLLPVTAAVLSLVVLVSARRLAAGEARVPTEPGATDKAPAQAPLLALAVAGAVVTLLGLTGALLLEGAPVWAVLAVLLTGAAAAFLVSTRAQVERSTATSTLGAGGLVLGTVGLVLSWSDEWLTLAACLTLLGPAALHHHRGPASVRAAGGVAVSGLLAGALWTGGALLDASAEWTGLVVLLVLAAWVIVRGLLDDLTGVAGVELGSASAALVTTLVAVDRAPLDRGATWLAVYLTVAGAAVTVVALTRPERRWCGWLGGLLLAAASWVRLGDLGVDTPEAYTLPSALALLVTGWWHTHRHREVGTLSAWSPGLGLALVPSLLWSFDDPVSWRALLLGLTCLALAVGGAQLRLAAPFVWGSGVGAVLAFWEVVPPAFEMSAWLVMGVAGAGLLVLGASWEQRVQDARAAVGYVRRLR